ncbi:MAG: hypothetical protein OXB93_04300 [Cytophagales bacterium]|nr:hypothetical protein [Cytophagales bacterium]
MRLPSYTAERRVFDRLKSGCSDQAKLEYELAFNTLIERYNTTIYENRFITGGAVEVFTYALLCSVGIDCTLCADQSKAGDILLPNDKKLLSLKGTFTGGASDVKLINQLGEGNRSWVTATFFIISEVGIVYGDPSMVDDEYIRPVADGLTLKRKAVVELIDDPSNIFPMKLCRKPPTEMTDRSHKASTAVAKQIMLEMKTYRLLNAFNP